MWLSMVLRAAQPRIAPLKAAVSGVANAPDGAFFPTAWTSIPQTDVINLKISLFI